MYQHMMCGLRVIVLRSARVREDSLLQLAYVVRVVTMPHGMSTRNYYTSVMYHQVLRPVTDELLGTTMIQKVLRRY